MSTSTPREDGNAARRRGTRALVIDAAVRLVAGRGFSATSVDDIAAEAGVAKGSVYYNFASKSDILEAALDEGTARLHSALSEARDTAPDGAKIDAMVRALLVAVHSYPDLAKLVAAEVFRAEREWQQSIAKLRAETISMFAVEIGLRRPGEDVSLIAAAVFGATLVAGLEWLVFQPDRTLDDVHASVHSLTSTL